MENKWDSEKYLKFEKERTQPAIDLVRRVEGRNVSSVLDVGCGPGNSSIVIKNIFPNADILGIDFSAEMIEKLYNCDAEAIREIGSLSQRGINPDDVITAYESSDQDTMDYLYQQAKRLVGLQELYKDLCFELSGCLYKSNVNIDSYSLRAFIQNTIGNKLTANEARGLDIKDKYNELAEIHETDYVAVDYLLEDDDIVAQFATLYKIEEEKNAPAKDEEQEKEEQMQIKDKNKAGV